MQKLRLIVSIPLALLLMLALSSCGSSKSVVGIWQDVDEEYCVIFSEDGTYTDSEFNLPFQYTVDASQITYYTPAGDLVCSEPQWTMRGHLRVYIGGNYRELKQVKAASNMYNWGQQDKFRTRKSKDSYSVKTALNIESELFINDSGEYLFRTTPRAEDNFIETQGLVAVSNDSRDFILYSNKGGVVDIMRASPYGMYLGALPMMNDGNLYSEIEYSNQSLGTQRGYLLDGVVALLDSGISYTFTTDSKCRKSLPTGETIPYNYCVSTEGLIALMSTDGILSTDYMYYDVEQGCIYRLVYQRDSWYDYVSQLSSPVKEETRVVKDWSVPSSLASPADRTKTIPVSYDPALIPQYQSIGQIEVAHSSWSIQQVQQYLQQLQHDETLRKEYEAAKESEQERIRRQMQSEDREREKVQAIMDARVQAEIAGGVVSPVFPDVSDTPSYNESVDDLSWLDSILASLDSQPSYDQDANSSSPVVNTDDNVSSETPETATPTPPPSIDEESSGTSVPQFDPAFTVDFVCTCVNCYVQALPVELNANDVLLVDATVIEPGTCLSLEGYGMVVARASGGYTSGQTAVCYSNIHNAVSRFSSGTYNVYQVVG